MSPSPDTPDLPATVVMFSAAYLGEPLLTTVELSRFTPPLPPATAMFSTCTSIASPEPTPEPAIMTRSSAINCPLASLPVSVIAPPASIDSKPRFRPSTFTSVFPTWETLPTALTKRSSPALSAISPRPKLPFESRNTLVFTTAPWLISKR